MARMIQALVIDGDRLNRVLLRDILEHEGLQVLDASGQQLGLQILRAAPCDLVITDYAADDEAEAMKLGELMRDLPETRFIALSPAQGFGHPVASLPEEERTNVRTLIKPVFRQELLRAIQELFPDWRPRDEG
ncbi:MAG: response regulator [Magnetococcales bacterium]|nr:response regulator [Magnetococcales bacterium]